MNHHGIGRINKKGIVDLPIDVLNPLSITQNVMVWGMLYPPDYSVTKNHHIKHDLILSPIPFDLWGKTVRLELRTPHKRGVFKRITELLKKNGASLLLSEASRSAYRHDTWTMILNFDGVVVNDFSEEYKLYKELVPRINSLEDDLKELSDSNFFYTEKNDEKLSSGYALYPHHANSYFYSTHRESRKFVDYRGHASHIHYKPFQFICDSNNRLIPTGTREFCSAIDVIQNELNNELFPCHTFAEMDTVDRNVRLAIIDSHTSKRCYSFGVSFSRFSSSPDTSAGLTDAVLKSFPDDLNAWAMVSKTDVFSKDREEGRLNLILFDEKNNKSISAREREAERIVENSKKYLPDNIKIVDFFVKSLEAERGQGTMLVNSDQLKHVFISYSSDNSKQALRIRIELENKGISCFLSEKKLEGGDLFDSVIRDALCAAYEVIILYSNSSKKSEWVKKETGAAWVLGKRIIPVSYQMSIEDLPSDLRKYQSYDYSDVVDNWTYPRELLKRIFKQYS